MAVLENEASTTTNVPAPPSADWLRRVGAVLLDGGVLGGVTWLAVGSGAAPPTLQPPFAGGVVTGAAAAEAVAWFRDPWVLATVALLVLLQAWTGATPGKRLCGIAVVRPDTGRPAGLLRTVARPLAHVVDSILLIGYLRPLWNARRQTFADSILDTVAVESRRAPLPPWLSGRSGGPSPRRSAVVTAAAALVCILGVGFSFPISRSETVPEGAPIPCDAATLPGGDALEASATYRELGYRIYDRRLWVERPATTSNPQITITWSWLPPDGSDAAAEQVADVRTSLDPDRSGPTLAFGLSPASTPGAPGVTADQTLGTEDVAGLGPDGWFESTLVVDGDRIATCTITGADLADL